MLDKKIFPEVPEVVHGAVLNALDSLEESSNPDNHMVSMQTKKKSRNTIYLRRIAVACLAIFLISGITVSAMEAINLYRQRMEAMNEELLDEYYSIAMQGEVTEMSRSLTDEERTRYDELTEQYEKNGLFPEAQITYLQDADAYSKEGIALDASNRTLYLPEGTLSDEELLEIIDFHHKISYSVYAENKEVENGKPWMERMAALDDAQVDEIYFTMFTTECDVSGAYSRMLTEDETRRYGELKRSYEQEVLYAASELPVIQTPEEYTGDGIAICVVDSTYYFPERELTDEELLQLIDMEHKAMYCMNRIGEEVENGTRDGFPHR